MRTYLLRVAPGVGECDYSLTVSVDGADLLDVAEGADWTLPPGYEREPLSGFFSLRIYSACPNVSRPYPL